LNSLRNVIIGLTAGVVALTGAIGASLIGGGIGAILSGGGLGKISGALKDKLGGALGGLAGGASKAGGAAGGGALPGASTLGDTLKAVGSGAGKGALDMLSGIGKGLGKGIQFVLQGLAEGIKAFANPKVLVGAFNLGAAIALIGAGAGIALWAIGKGLGAFSEGLDAMSKIDGSNLISVGLGIAAIGAGMLVFSAGLLVGTAGGVVSGIASLFGVKSPLERVKEFVPIADKISLIGTGIKEFGEGVLAIGKGIKDFNGDALSTLKDKLLEFAEAGASDEVKLTAQYLTAIGSALTAISDVGDIKLPAASDMAIPNVSADMVASLSPNESIVNTASGSALTPEALEQLMSYLSSMQNDLAAIRGNTRVEPGVAPVRLT
jgi:hypothetical protein